ncbi:hypothetical protein [Nannocystis pusilla]|uniref:hypothetical protein n=1 Tax=Nannocystis pusilla TaxID=889268 RepID=UPI003B7E0C9A
MANRVAGGAWFAACDNGAFVYDEGQKGIFWLPQGGLAVDQTQPMLADKEIRRAFATPKGQGAWVLASDPGQKLAKLYYLDGCGPVEPSEVNDIQVSESSLSLFYPIRASGAVWAYWSSLQASQNEAY